METSRFRFSHDVLVHLKNGTDTSDLLNFHIDTPFWPKNYKSAILGPKKLKKAPKIAILRLKAKVGGQY